MAVVRTAYNDFVGGHIAFKRTDLNSGHCLKFVEVYEEPFSKHELHILVIALNRSHVPVLCELFRT